MIDSGDLCGYIYFTSSSSFLYFCAICKNYFKSCKDFQNHSLKEHLHIKSNQNIEANFSEFNLSTYTSNVKNTIFSQKIDETNKCTTVDYKNDEKLKIPFIEIKKVDFSDQENNSHDNFADEISGLVSPNSSVDFNSDNEQKHSEFTFDVSIRDLTDKSESNLLPLAVNDLNDTNLQCKYCKIQFSKLDRLIQHTKDHLNYVLTCRICGKHSYRKCHALNHEKTHAKTQCEICERSFSSDNDLENHLKTHPILKCTLCTKNFKKICDIQNHLKMVHFQEKETDQYDLYPGNFTLKNDLEAHVNAEYIGKNNLREKLYQCKFCENKLKNESELKQHNLKNHSEINKIEYFCRVCSQNFNKLDEFEKHMENTHSKIQFPHERDKINHGGKLLVPELMVQKTIDSNFNLSDAVSEEFTVKLENELEIKIEKNDFNPKQSYLKVERNDKENLLLNATSEVEENSQIYANMKNTPTTLPFELNDFDDNNLQCKYCKKQFSARTNLIQHTKDHLNYILTCKICGKHSSRKSHAQSHERTHIKLRCDLCDATFSNEKALEKHKTRHEKLRCKFCFKIFKKCDAIQNHLRTHTGEKPYKCDVCSAAFAIKKNLQTHIITQHTGDIKNFDCKFCDRKFKTKQLRDWHTKRVHLKEKPNQCEICGLNFANMSGLRRHKLKRHTEYNNRPHPCKLCDKKFVELKNLTEHMNTHTGEKPFQCNICMKSFGQQSSLREHKKLHTGKKTHICKICGKGFAQHSGCSNHMKQHHMISNAN